MTINPDRPNANGSSAPKQPQNLKTVLLNSYANGKLWGHKRPSYILPDDQTERGSESHLIFLTLTITLAGDRDPDQLWEAARRSWGSDPELFDPKFLAYLRPHELKTLQPRLAANKLARSPKSETTTWQRIGKAIIMRGQGSVKTILDKSEFEASQLMAMLEKGKPTFPVLSGEQTAPRWLHALAVDGSQPIRGVDNLLVPLSESGELATEGLSIPSTKFTVPTFDPLDTLGRLGCRQRRGKAVCPAAENCPVSSFCQFGNK